MTAAPFTRAQAARLYIDMPLEHKQEFRDFYAFYAVLQWFEGVHNIGAIPAALPSPAWCAEVDAELAATAVEDAAVQQPVAWSLQWPIDVKNGTVNANTTFSSYYLAQEYAGRASNRDSRVTVVPLYATPMPVDAALVPSLFWEIDDGENSSSSIEDLIYERDVGEELVIGRAMEMSSIRIRVIAEPDSAAGIGYEVIGEVKPPAIPLPAFAQELADFGALLDPDSLEQAS